MIKNICDYGCKKQAKFQLKNKKFCCCKTPNSCSGFRYKNSLSHTGNIHNQETRNKISKSNKGKIVNEQTRNNIREALKKKREKGWINHPEKTRKILSEKAKLKKLSKETIEKIQKSRSWYKHHTKETRLKIRYSIEKINRKYPFFSQIEEIRYNPDKPEEKEIQVHCKNHNCENSKEKGGWFTPTRSQLLVRIGMLEKDDGNEGSYFYCTNECKQQCPLYGFQYHPEQKDKLYTSEEYQTFRKFVLDRDNYICQFCGEKAIEVHHEKPQKLEPFFALDPDYAWSCCEKCHYKKAHKNECSTGKLANKIC